MSQDRAAQLVEAGIWLKLSGDLDGARKLFERALKLDPGNKRAAELLAGAAVTSPSGMTTVPGAPSSPSSPGLGVEHRAAPAAPSRPTPAPSLEGDWGRFTGVPSPVPQGSPSSASQAGAVPARSVVLGSPSPLPQAPVMPAVNVVLGSPSPVPQPVPVMPAVNVVLGSPSPPPQAALPAVSVVLGSPSPPPQAAMPAMSVVLGSASPPPQAAMPAMNVVLGSPSPVPQPPPSAELGGAPEPAHRGATMQFVRPPELGGLSRPGQGTLPLARPQELGGEPEPAHRGPTMQFARPPALDALESAEPQPLGGEPEPAHRGATMQFARPQGLGGEPEPAHRGGTMQFARPQELGGEPEPAHRGGTMQFARPQELGGEPEPAHRGGTMQFARPPELGAARGQAPAASVERAPPEDVGGEPEPAHRGATMQFTRPPGVGAPAVGADDWGSPEAWSAEGGPPPTPAEPETPKGRTMQFARGPELSAAIKAAKGAPGFPLEIEPMGAPPEVVPAAAPSPASAPAKGTMLFARSAELDEALAAARAALRAGAPAASPAPAPPAAAAAPPPSAPAASPSPEAPAAWDVPAWELSPAPPAPAPVQAPEVQKGGTMQFAQPSELADAVKVARAARALEVQPAGAQEIPLEPVKPPSPSAPTRTMQFARPPEVVAALKAARATQAPVAPSKQTLVFAGSPLEVEPLLEPDEVIPGTPKGGTMQFARTPELDAAIKAARAATQPPAPAPAPAPVAPPPAPAPESNAEPSPWDVPAWDTSPSAPAPAPADAAPETPKGGTMVFARPSEVTATRTTGKLFRPAAVAQAADELKKPPEAAPTEVLPWDTSPAPPAPAPEPWTSSAAGPRSTQQLFGGVPPATVQLEGAPPPQPSPPTTPPLFGAPPTSGPSPSKGGLQALGEMLGSTGSDSPAPSSPPLFSGPAMGEPPPEAANPDTFAWAWSSSSPAPRADDDLVPPRPSPALSPRATSAWDQRSNPGVKIDDVVGDDRAIELLSSDSKITRSPDAKDQVPSLLKSARDLLDLDDHTGAMELILKAQALAPDDPEVKAMRERSEKTLLTMFESKLGKLDTVPRVLLKDDEIIWLNLDHRAGFVLAQIDGTVTFDDLFSVSGMSRIDTARILAQLVEEGVISRG